MRVYPEGKLPKTNYVAGSNFADIGITVDERLNRAVIVSCIDNLIKGAAGQAGAEYEYNVWRKRKKQELICRHFICRKSRIKYRHNVPSYSRRDGYRLSVCVVCTNLQTTVGEQPMCCSAVL